MTWDPPSTYITGQLIDPDDFNVYIHGNMAHLASMTVQGTALSALSASSEITASLPIGTPIPNFCTSAPSGYILAAGGTIGSGSSNATTRANDDTEALFTHFYDNLDNTLYPLENSAGSPIARGASAAADFAANRRMPIPDLRGITIIGLDNMNGVSRDLVTDSEADTVGDEGGAASITQTSSTLVPHTHTVPYSNNATAYGNALRGSNVVAGNASSNSTGDGNALANMQPYISVMYLFSLT